MIVSSTVVSSMRFGYLNFENCLARFSSLLLSSKPIKLGNESCSSEGKEKCGRRQIETIEGKTS